MLTIASFVLRHKRPEGAETADYARDIISDFLIYDMPLVRACEWTPLGSLYLPKLVWNRSLRDSGEWSLTRLLQTELHYRRWEFSRSLVQAVRRGDRGLVVWLMDHFEGCPISNLVIETAAGCGHLWLLQLLENDKSHGEIQWKELNDDRDTEVWCEALNEAAKRGHWEVVRWLDERINTHETRGRNTSVTAQAILRSDVDQFDWAKSAGFAVDFVDCLDLCDGDWRVSSATIKYLVDAGIPSVACFALERAAASGDLELVQWLVQHSAFTQHATDAEDEYSLAQAVVKASESGHLDTVKWVLSHIDHERVPYDPSGVMFAAAMSGNLELVTWLYERYSTDASVNLFQEQPDQSEEYLDLFPCNAMDVAAKCGHLEVLQFLHGISSSLLNKQKEQHDGEKNKTCRSPRCTVMAMNAAAESGYLDVVKWLHENRDEGCSTDAMDRAAANGHVDVVKWLHENRCEGCTSAAMDDIASKVYHAEGPYCHTETGACCKDKEPVEFGADQLRFLQWLQANYSVRPTKQAMDGAAANGNFQMLQWLHENTAAGCSDKAMNSAAAAGWLDIVRWLHQNRQENRPDEALEQAAKRGKLKVVEWLLHNHAGLDTTRAMDMAIWSVHFDVALTLHHHRPALYEGDKLDLVKNQLIQNAPRFSECRYVLEWVEATYPVREDK